MFHRNGAQQTNQIYKGGEMFIRSKKSIMLGNFNVFYDHHKMKKNIF